MTYTVTARDLVGNVGKVSAVRTATALPELSAKRTGAWATRTSASRAAAPGRGGPPGARPPAGWPAAG